MKARLVCKTEEGISLILRQPNKRMGTIPTRLEAQIQTLPLPELESLLDFIHIADLEQWLRSHD